MAEPAWKRAGFDTANAYNKANKVSEKWSREHSRVETSRWDPKFTPEQKGSYFRAIASPTTGIIAHSRRNPLTGGGSKLLRKFLTKDTHRITEEKWKATYVGLD